MEHTSSEILDRYGIDERRGFLSNEDPLVRFGVDGHRPAVADYLAALDELGEDLPALLEDREAKRAIDALEAPPEGFLDDLTEREKERLCLLTGFLASGYVNQLDSEPVDRLPAGIAVPLYDTSQSFGRKPIISYDFLCLHNFQRRDAEEGFTLDNLDTVQQFTTLSDERWFVIIHVAIESAAGPGLVAAANAQDAVREDDPEALRANLETMADSLKAQTDIMGRMTEGNAPEAFATEYRPYYDGFDEVVYEGVDVFEGNPRSYRGGSGAQSCVLPSIDEALGIEHPSTALLEKLLDMRTYMPDKHRSVVDAFAEDVDIRPYVVDRDDPELEAAFNECIEQLRRFRRVHFGQVMQYIKAQTGETTGTGGTDYEDFLPKMENETAQHKV